MRKMFFAFVATLFTTYAAMAQVDKLDNGDKHAMTSQQRTERQVLRLEKELTLNAAQKEQVFALLSKSNDELDGIRKSSGDDKAGMRDKMKGVKAETEKAMKGILTADQFQKYQDLEQARKEKRAEHIKGGKKPSETLQAK